MLATLYYEPLWVFHRGGVEIDQLNNLLFKRIAVGLAGSGTRKFAEALLAANGLTRFNTDQRLMGNLEALRAMQRDEIDVALMVGPVQTPAIWQALHDPSIQLMGIVRDEAYVRRFPYIVRLKLPAGAVELAQNIPAEDVTLIGTKAMLVARDGLPPALVNLLIDAAHEIHGGQGYFEVADEFPSTARVDIEVSAAAQRHKQFGPNLLHRYMPFWVATFLERLIILVVPLLVILVPLMNYLPQALRWRLRARVYRWYGELKMLEREVAAHEGTPPIEKWLRHLDRIERAAQEIKTPVSLASEAYTLREHVALVRRAIMSQGARIALLARSSRRGENTLRLKSQARASRRRLSRDDRLRARLQPVMSTCIRKNPMRRHIACFLALVTAVGYAALARAEMSAEELAKLAQNPVGNLISVPFQDNVNLNVGPDKQTQNILTSSRSSRFPSAMTGTSSRARSCRSSRSPPSAPMRDAPAASATSSSPRSCLPPSPANGSGAWVPSSRRRRTASRRSETTTGESGRRSSSCIWQKATRGCTASWSTMSGRRPATSRAVATATD